MVIQTEFFLSHLGIKVGIRNEGKFFFAALKRVILPQKPQGRHKIHKALSL